MLNFAAGPGRSHLLKGGLRACLRGLSLVSSRTMNSFSCHICKGDPCGQLKEGGGRWSLMLKVDLRESNTGRWMLGTLLGGSGSGSVEAESTVKSVAIVLPFLLSVAKRTASVF